MVLRWELADSEPSAVGSLHYFFLLLLSKLLIELFAHITDVVSHLELKIVLLVQLLAREPHLLDELQIGALVEVFQRRFIVV